MELFFIKFISTFTLLKISIKTSNLINYKTTILIYNILRDLGLIPTLKGTKFLNKAIQIVLNSNNEFIVLEDVYKKIALNYTNFNGVQVRNAIRYTIDNRDEEKSIAYFERIFGYKYDRYYFTNKAIIEEIVRFIVRNFSTLLR